MPPWSDSSAVLFCQQPSRYAPGPAFQAPSLHHTGASSYRPRTLFYTLLIATSGLAQFQDRTPARSHYRGWSAAAAALTAPRGLLRLPWSGDPASSVTRCSATVSRSATTWRCTAASPPVPAAGRFSPPRRVCVYTWTGGVASASWGRRWRSRERSPARRRRRRLSSRRGHWRCRRRPLRWWLAAPWHCRRRSQSAVGWALYFECVV